MSGIYARIYHMRFAPETYKRCIREGHDHWGSRGPAQIQAPYNRDDRAGAWNYGRTQARQGFSKSQAWKNFRKMEGI